MNSSDLIFWAPGVTLDAIERQVIIRAFDYYKKNMAATSRALNIDARTLKAKLAKYDLDEVEEKKREAQRRKEQDDFLARCRGQVPAGAQYDHSASRPVPLPQNGLNPTGYVPEEADGVQKTPMPDGKPADAIAKPARKRA